MNAPTMRVYLGRTLGWAKVVGVSTAYQEPADPTAWFRTSDMYDEIAERRLKRTMDEYLAAKRAFFDYARQKGIESHNAKAKELLNSAVADQYFGLDEASQDKIKSAEAEVSAALELELKRYRTNPKSDESAKGLIGSVVACQFFGASNSAAYDEAQAEVLSILELKAEGPSASEESLRQRRREIRQRAGRAVDGYAAEPEPKSLTAKMTLVDVLSEVRIALPETDALRRNLEAQLLRLLNGGDPHLQR